MKGAWPRVQLGQLLRRSDETIPLLPDGTYREITVRLWGKGVVPRGTVTGIGVAAQRRRLVRKGMLILSRIDARNGALGIVPPELDGAIATNDFPVFRLQEDRLLPGYLGWLCQTAAFVEECRRASEGTTNRVRLQEDKFLCGEISLPPLPEQQRIVERIEELAARTHAAHALRRQAAGEAEALHVAWLRFAMVDSSAHEIDLQQACDAIIDNLHSNPRYANSGVPCVRSSDVGWGTLSLVGSLRTDEAEYRRRTVRGTPQADDIVLVREGGGTGKCALVLPSQRFSLGQRVMILRPNRTRILPKFFLYQLLSPLVQEHQIMPFSKGSASPHLNIGLLRRFRLRLPSLPEQRRIVTRLDAALTEMNALKRQHTETAADLDALLPAILDRAFRGEL